MNIDQRKRRLINKYGLETTICFYYYLWNVVNYCGEKRVRQSFKSIKGQGNEVIVGLYDPKDNTEKIAKEYGFKVVIIEKGNIAFPESKIRNRIILESKSNFLCGLNINVEYPKQLTSFIKKWIDNNDIRRSALKLRYKMGATDGSVRDKYYGFSFLFYRPYLIEARGYDERTAYALGSQKYGVVLLKNFYNIRTNGQYIGLVHKSHHQFKTGVLSRMYPNVSQPIRRSNVGRLIHVLKNNFKRSFEYGVSKVKNSYW